MIRTLTDYKTGEKFRVVATDPYLPCFGEDGIMYFWLTNPIFCSRSNILQSSLGILNSL